MANIVKDSKELLQGRKTYLVAIVAVVLGLLQAFEIYTVPGWAWPFVGAAGLGALRLGVKATAEMVEEVKKKTK